VAALVRRHPDVRHLPVEDGPGQPLGRSFQVKLWPTFVFLRDGRVVRRLVRPGREELRQGFDALTGTAP
jgi:thioredoxin 1